MLTLLVLLSIYIFFKDIKTKYLNLVRFKTDINPYKF